MGLEISAVLTCDSCMGREPSTAVVVCNVETKRLGSQTVITDLVPKLPDGWGLRLQRWEDSGEDEPQYQCPKCYAPERR
jgi:hypothetical protein